MKKLLLILALSVPAFSQQVPLWLAQPGAIPIVVSSTPGTGCVPSGSAGQILSDSGAGACSSNTTAAGILTWIGTPSSANLAAAVTNETGSGLLVFGTSPTIVTPTIASFTNATHDHSNAAGGGQITLTTGVTGVLPTANMAVALANQTSLRGNAMAAAAGDATIGQVIAHGSKALDFASTGTGACATVITDTATGTASTDVVWFSTNASIKAVTGFVPASTGGFSVNAFPSTDLVSFEACNWTSGTVDPGSITVNWKVIR